MNVLIFGVTGNCGTYCAKRFLENGHVVYGIGRSKISFESRNMNFIQGNINDTELFKKIPTNFDMVVNFAGVQPSILPTSENTDLENTLKSYVEVNINGIFNVLEFVRKSNIGTYIYSTSHRDIELSWSDDHFLTNDAPININYGGDHAMYAISKTSGKMMGDYYGKAFGIRVFNLRLPMMFLVPDNPTYLKDGKLEIMPFLRVIRNSMKNNTLEIWGDPKLRRDYVHVENLFSLIELCYASNLDGGTYGVGTGEAVITENFIKSIAREFSEKPEEIKYIYRPEKTTYKCAIYDVSKQKEDLGYEPILLEEMLTMLHSEIEQKDCIRKWGWR